MPKDGVIEHHQYFGELNQLNGRESLKHDHENEIQYFDDPEKFNYKAKT